MTPRELAAITPIVRAYVPSDNEAQTEEELIRPVLRALGHTFEVQAALKTPDGTKKPFYIFYRDLAALDANKNRTLDEALLHGKAFAVGDAKYWDRPLDQNLKHANADPFTNKNPAYQIAFYIQHSGVEWGVLTNGRLWRLYHRDTAHKQDRFYEVDLTALVETNDPEAFLYFYAFFHRTAFEPAPLSLDALLKESATYARGVGESLKGQVYDALKELAQGFLDYPGNALQTDTATLKQIYDHSLIVLYRLLFILYAEAALPNPQLPSPMTQVSMLDDADFARSMGLAVGSMWLIEETAGNTLAEVREQERLYVDLRAELTRKYQKLADVAAARDFGLSVGATLWKGLSDYLARGGFEVPQYATVLKDAEAQAEVQRFFHWDLEFPEVFFDRHGQPLGERGGFDAVIGNPPYVRQEQLAPIKPCLEQAYSETYAGTADLYVYFVSQGLRVLQQGGRMSYIVTNKWLRAGYGEPLRAFFAAQSSIKQIIDFGHAPIFEGADVFPCIIVLEKPTTEANRQPDDHQVQVTAFPREALRLVQLDGYIRKYGHPVPQRRFSGAPWSLEASDVEDLMERIKRVGVPLAEFAGVKPYYGIKTGLNEAFLIDTPTRDRLVREDPRSAEIIKPYLRGQDIKRWVPEWSGLWIIFARRGIEINDYPAILRHLLQYRERLEPKPHDWQGDQWIGRKPGSYC